MVVVVLVVVVVVVVVVGSDKTMRGISYGTKKVGS